MHILPPEDPSRSSARDDEPPPSSNRNGGNPSHYHYHAGGDAEERIRREAVRDYLVDDIIRRDARRRRRWKFGIVFVLAGLFITYTALRLGSVPPTPVGSAVQVSTEYRDGKWVATAQRVPAPTPSPTVRPLESYPGYAPGSGNTTSGTTQDSAEDDGQATDQPNPDIIARYRADHPRAETAASRRCQGHYVSEIGAVFAVSGRTATLWTRKDIQQGNATGEQIVGEPTATGLLFRQVDGSGTAQFQCYPDRVTFVFASGERVTAPRTSAEQAEETLTAWMLER